MKELKKAFLSIPIQGIRSKDGIYNSIIRIIISNDFEVINKDEILNPPSKDKVIQLNPNEVHKHDLDLLKNSQVFITEITNPSLGVGYEIAIAEHLELPIIYLYNSINKKEISLMILGSNYKNRVILDYKTESELEKKLIVALHQLQLNENKIKLNRVIDHFKNKAKHYDEAVNWRHDKKMLYWFRNSLKDCRKCLDIGTGTGLIGSELKKNGTFVIGVDISSKMLQIANKRLDFVVQADISNLPFLDNQFEGISLRQVLHYVEDVTKCVREAYRVLQVGGILSCAHVTSPTKEMKDWWQGLKTIVQPVRKRCFQIEDLCHIYRSVGFKIINTEIYRNNRVDEWDNFLINSDIKYPRKEVDSFFNNTSNKIKDIIKLRLEPTKISYIQDWSLIICKKV